MSEKKLSGDNGSDKEKPLQGPPILLSPARPTKLPALGSQSKGLSAPLAVGSSTGNPRNKVALQPGFSLMDWIRLTQSGVDLAGTGGQFLQVTPEELKGHYKRKDAWLVINGIVFNVTSYMDYHPGGFDELLKGAGKDATNMFNKVHKWVNYESMLKACIVGKLVVTSLPPVSHNRLLHGSDSSGSSPKVIPPIGSRSPTTGWFQTDTTLTIAVYTRRPEISADNVITKIVDEKLLQILVMINDEGKEEMVYQVAYSLASRLETNEPPKVSVGSTSGKVEIVFKKVEEDSVRWPAVGSALPGNNIFVPVSEFRSESFEEYLPWALASVENITHDVMHFVFDPPENMAFHYSVPCGHHVYLNCDINGMGIVRAYTPTYENLDLGMNTRLFSEKKSFRQSLHLIIKIYDDGAMTPYLKSLAIGTEVLIGNHTGDFASSRLKKVNHLVLIAAGSGFTPMPKILQKFYQYHEQQGRSGKRKCSFLFFNKTEPDIIWRNQLDQVEKETLMRDDFKVEVHHILSQDPGWSGLKGRISANLLQDILSEHLEDSGRMACICGPLPFTDMAHGLLVKDLNFDESDVVLFKG